MKKRYIAALSAGTTIASSYYAYKATKSFTKSMIKRDVIDKENMEDKTYDVFTTESGEKMTYYVYPKENAKRVFIMVPKYGENVESLLPVYEYFSHILEDTTIILLNLIGHGSSEGQYRISLIPTFVQFNNYIHEQMNLPIDYYGEGIGANVILTAMSTGELKGVRRIMSNGAATTMLEYLSDQCFKKTMVPVQVSQPIIRRVIKKECKVDINLFDTVTSLERIKVPVLFMHERFSDDVKFSHVLELYNHFPYTKELIPLTTHLEEDTNEEYQEEIKSFLK